MNMTRALLYSLAATTAFTASMPVHAQNTEGATAQREASEASVGDIVVTARRGEENLQDVPVSVKVVSGDSIQNQAITTLGEVSKLAPGLNITNDDQKIVLRGVAWRPGSGTPATPIYFNEIPFDPGSTIRTIFDIGQIEVLRGPQGTTRGAPSISGAVTIRTRRPDLDAVGGYVQGTYGQGDHSDVQGALSVPVIEGVLAVRLAANIEDSRFNRVTSVNSNEKPYFRDRTLRFSALFKPTDTLTFDAMYQRTRGSFGTFIQVVGPGSQGAAGIPANFNGPALTAGDRKAVQDAPTDEPFQLDLITFNAQWNVLGQQLSYNFGSQHTPVFQAYRALDPANFLPGYQVFQFADRAPGSYFRIHEVRLSSERSAGRFFDYDIGYFQKHSAGTQIIESPNFLSGAFGAPGTAPGVITTPNSRYVLGAHTDISLAQKFDSFYGNIEIHLGGKTELSGGLRRIKDRVPVTLNVQTSAAASVAIPLSALRGAPCSAAGLVSSNYAGFCDANVAAGTGNLLQAFDDQYKKTIYNVSLSHKFTDDLLAYATSGSSYRSGLPAIANNGLPAAYLVPLPETAKSYELGVKTTIGRRLRINGSIYQIDYKNQLTTFQGIQYYNSVSARLGLTSEAFYRNVDARIRGAELEISAQPIDNLSLGANVSYAITKSRGGDVPCNDASRPITPSNPINQCPSRKGETLNQSPPFQASVNGSYSVPVGGADAYLRFNLNYQGHNPNYGNAVSTGAYAIVDLFAGLAGTESGWDVGLYAKNIFDKQVELSRATLLNNIYPGFTAAPTGYYSARVSAPREVGISLRYTFGSH